MPDLVIVAGKRKKETDNGFTLNRVNRVLFRQVSLICLMILMFSPKGSSQDNFQQEVNYEIQVTLDDRRHELNAFMRIEYINNSYDSLGFMFFHLWPNAWSGNNTSLAGILLSWNS